MVCGNVVNLLEQEARHFLFFIAHVMFGTDVILQKRQPTASTLMR